MTSALSNAQNTEEVGQASSVFETVRLDGVLPAGSLLTINHQAGILTRCDETRIVAQDFFTVSEMCVLVPLLRSHPAYCPYELLQACWTNVRANVTQEVIETCRRRLYAALLNGTYDQELRPIRNVVSRTRIKVEQFGIDVTSILETGYLLSPLAPGRTRMRKGERQRVSA